MTTRHHAKPSGDECRERIVAYIRRYVERNGHAPTQRQIADAVGVNESTVRWHLDVLEREGRVVREFKRARSVEVVE